MQLHTIEITNEQGANRVINHRDLEEWRGRGYYPVGEEPVEVIEEEDDEVIEEEDDEE